MKGGKQSIWAENPPHRTWNLHWSYPQVVDEAPLPRLPKETGWPHCHQAQSVVHHNPELHQVQGQGHYPDQGMSQYKNTNSICNLVILFSVSVRVGFILSRGPDNPISHSTSISQFVYSPDRAEEKESKWANCFSSVQGQTTVLSRNSAIFVRERCHSNSKLTLCSVADTNMYNGYLDLTSAFVMSVMRTDRFNLLPVDLYVCMYINHPICSIPVSNSQLMNN